MSNTSYRLPSDQRSDYKQFRQPNKPPHNMFDGKSALYWLVQNDIGEHDTLLQNIRIGHSRSNEIEKITQGILKYMTHVTSKKPKHEYIDNNGNTAINPALTPTLRNRRYRSSYVNATQSPEYFMVNISIFNGLLSALLKCPNPHKAAYYFAIVSNIITLRYPAEMSKLMYFVSEKLTVFNKKEKLDSIISNVSDYFIRAINGEDGMSPAYSIDQERRNTLNFAEILMKQGFIMPNKMATSYFCGKAKLDNISLSDALDNPKWSQYQSAILTSLC